MNIKLQLKADNKKVDAPEEILASFFGAEPSLIDTKKGVSVIGGHYCLSPDLAELSNHGAPEINSFLWACRLILAAREKGIPATLILFVNDIGIDSESRRKIIDCFSIPDNYLKILNDHAISKDNIEIIFESAIRNRASKEVRKIKKLNKNFFEIIPSNDPRLIRCIDPAYCEISDTTKQAITVLGPNGEQLVVKDDRNPKCNTILAVLFDRVANEIHDGLIINCFNAIYRNRLSLGGWVYGLLSKEKKIKEAPIINLFFDEDGLTV